VKVSVGFLLLAAAMFGCAIIIWLYMGTQMKPTAIDKGIAAVGIAILVAGLAIAAVMSAGWKKRG
jgi:hypothetical protein